MAGKILNVATSEAEDCLCVCIIRQYRSEILIDWVMLGKDMWNSEGRMSSVNGVITMMHFKRSDLMEEIYSFYKDTVGTLVAKQNMTLFAKYIQKEEKINDR